MAAVPIPVLNHLPVEVICECVALDQSGAECGRLTDRGNMCPQHAASVLGVRVAASNIAGAGDGLFATRRFERGDVVCEYGPGRVYSSAEFAASPSAYGVRLYRGVLDCRNTNEGFGRYVNAATRTSEVNCILVSEAKLRRGGSGKRVFVQCKRAQIQPGEELYLAYGAGFWREQAPAGARGV